MMDIKNVQKNKLINYKIILIQLNKIHKNNQINKIYK